MMTKKNIVCGMISLVHKITGTNTYEWMNLLRLTVVLGRPRFEAAVFSF